MLKTLLFILVIVILVALVLNFDIFTKSPLIKEPIKIAVQEVSTEPSLKKVTPTLPSVQRTIKENNLSKELQLLFTKAKRLYAHNKYNEALLIYEKIIEKSKNNNDPKILLYFAKSCLEKALIHYGYPTYGFDSDSNSAIETYDLMVNVLEKRNNKELLLMYMKAKVNQASLSSKEEVITAYSELIEKFTNDKEKRFEKEVEEMLFAKSFTLMGIDDEEAIEVLDSIIAKYDDKSNLPETVKYSILNNIELSIITNNDSEKYVDLANEYMSNSPDTKPLLDMLSIINNAQELEQEEAFETWVNEHKDYNFPDWDFSELRKWVNKMETPDAQKRIRHYLDAFEKKKYAKYYQTVPSPSPTSTQNTYPDPYPAQNEEIIYEEIPAYEPDPYLNDIISTEPETTYPNPYSDYAPSPQSDGVSHTYDSSY